MCIGIPMQVLTVEPGHAWCEGMGARRRVSTALVGEQPIGTWLLVFLESARSVLDAEEAGRISRALEAVMAAMRGEPVDHLFSDLVGREPQLPEFLRAAADDR